MKTFYVTTPIYYSNGIPHIGHAYSSFISDVLARYHRSLGEDVKFSTGVDENSQKVVEKAAEAGASEAQFHLGKCYLEGTGVEKDPKKDLICFFIQDPDKANEKIKLFLLELRGFYVNVFR